MCIVSNVHDFYQPLMPTPQPAPYTQPSTTITYFPAWPTAEEQEELRQLIKDFKAAVKAAKKLDKLMGNPDCVDPEKAKLKERVKELEFILEGLRH